MPFDADELDALRPALLAFCYQMLGSPFDAEDAVQDVFERALRARSRFDSARASLSTWCHRIARNVCIDRLRAAPRRPLPRDLSEPGIEIGAPLVPALDVPWLMPAPGRWFEPAEPERTATRRHDVRLAVTAMLQRLPPRQRGVLVLRDVLGYSAAETAQILELTPAAVNSSLQRARAATRAAAPGRGIPSRSIVERYALAIERADAAALAALVAEDVVLEMPPVPAWSRGRDEYAAFMRHLFEWRGTGWRTRLTTATGQPAMLLYRVTADGDVPHTLQLFVGTDHAIDHVLVYQDARLFALFEDHER
ncbi:sigma-70 family RNA polymerase sigma factor [Microbacterium protaetiae]|uniref:Sigma-70 family RNA polymerase sigma factor n=1 Tax=Microbacterium protaetiae TaxID=2509458 RepID=A0A4P6EI35_9MICO|nr:sigma-70 family RNA polymerase sigma factor [Microbacterium protaetiae]